ncbi:MAG: DNA double-strand break repair nuclease NurA [Candidatus Helarchaeota archaeon]
MENLTKTPFEELPEALVEEMLNRCGEISANLSANFKQISDKKDELRNKLIDEDLLHEDDRNISPFYPTSCGIDGSYVVEKLVATDIAAVAAVAVEGLTPPGPEKRFWPKPRHFSDIEVTVHSDATSLILRGIMMNLELQLAYHTPHDVVFLDGSLTTPFIYFNQTINRLNDAPVNLSMIFRKGKDKKNEDDIKFPSLKDSFKAYENILQSKRTDKIFAGIPKYTTRNEISERVGIKNFEDRGFLNFILKKGEYVGPMPLKKPESEWHIKIIDEIKDKTQAIINNLNNLEVIYYKPSDYFPVIRVEVSKSVSSNTQRRAILFESLRIQCTAPAIMEPFPTYLADKMVKNLKIALPAIRRTSTQEMASKWEYTPADIFLAMHGYRTEWGK